MKKLVVVLSGDIKHSLNRIKTGLEKSLLEYEKGGEVSLLLNGFNTGTQHDAGFSGGWQDDERIRPHLQAINSLEKTGIKIDVVYARNTAENVIKTPVKDYDVVFVVTDDWHTRRTSLGYYAYHGPIHKKQIKFSPVKNYGKEKFFNLIKETINLALSYFSYLGLSRLKPQSIVVSNKRNNLIKKVLKFKF